MALNDTRIRTAKKKTAPYKLADEKGLYIEVRPTGAKFWRYRYRIDGNENVYSFGEYRSAPENETPEEAQTRRASDYYTLEEARQERLRARALVKQGIHPVQAKKRRDALQRVASANTFEIVAREWLEKNKSDWSAGYYDDVKRVLEADVFPKVGALPIRQVSAALILEILDVVAKRGAPTLAINIRQWCGAIFAHAVRTLRADGDPTGVLKGHIKRPDVQHKTPLTKDGIKDLVGRIESSGYAITRIALKLLLYVFVRPSELRRAEWTEFDLERAVWEIPAEKMKKRERHLVPLSAQVIALLRGLQAVTGGRRYLFPNHRRPNDCVSENTFNLALKRLGYGSEFTAHGFRATASTELHEMGYRSDIIEFQLAHAERDETKASYNQAQYMAERREMMKQWADMVDAWARGDKVVPIGRAA
jgi:integrase